MIIGFSLGSIVDAKEPEWSPSWVMLRYGSHPALMLIAVAPFGVGIAYGIEQLRRARRFGRAGIDLVEFALCAAYLVLAASAVRNVFLCLLPLACMVLRAPPSRAFAIAALLLVLVMGDYATRDAYGGWDRMGIAYARDFSGYSLPVLGFAREAVSRALATPLAEGLRIEADLSTLAFQTRDATECMAAFIEKRKAKFTDE